MDIYIGICMEKHRQDRLELKEKLSALRHLTLKD